MDHQQVEFRVSSKTQAFLAQEHRLLINGQWVKGASAETIATYDPATGEWLARVAVGDASDVDLAVAAARRAFNGPWSKFSAEERAATMHRLADLIDQNADLLAEIEILDNGMSRMIAKIVVSDSAETLRYYAGWASKIEGRTISSNTYVAGEGESLTYTLREPIGVVGQIVPWNVPFAMACLKMAPALAAGCTMVLKPAEQTPLSALLLGELVIQAGFPKGVFNVINGFGETVGAAIAAHPDIDKVAFTGSTDVGRLIVKAATGNLKRVSLELGGKSPAVVFPDADLSIAIPGLAQATFFLQGQNCMAGTRIFVHTDIYDKVVAGVSAVAAGLKIGPGLDPSTQIGPLITEEHRERVLSFIKAGIDQGARLTTGGTALPGPGNFIQPTVFADAEPGMRIVDEEIFGPVMSILRFEGDDLDAIAEKANNTVFGLSGSVWTQNLSLAHKMVSRIRSGHVSINCHGAVASNIPFGGYKQSGWGREYGEEGLDPYLETKAVTARL